MKFVDKFKVGSQIYEFDRVGDHYSERQGRRVEIGVYRTLCPDCGDSFEIQTTLARPNRKHHNRRCQDCKRPGVRVDATKLK